MLKLYGYLNRSMKWHLRIAYVLFFFFFVSCRLCHGATYYVNNSGTPACENIAGNGTLAKPWCSITYGLSNMNSGDTLYVMAGTYNESLYIYRPAGTPAKWTVIKAYPGHIVNLVGSGVNVGRNKIINTSYLVFDGFNITNYNHGIYVENANNIKILNCDVHHIGQQAVTIHYDSYNVLVQNCKIHDTRQWQYNGEGLYIGTSSSGPLDNTNNITIRNSIIYNTTDEGIELKPGTHDCLIENNVLYNIMTDPDYAGSAGAIEINQATISCPSCINGLQTWPSNPNHLVRNNIVHSSKTGIRAGTGSSVYNNVIYNIQETFQGILVNNSSSDNYMRKIYHNTVDLSADRAVIVSSGTADVKNNIGPSSLNNIVSNSSYFVSTVKGSEDYHLVSGSAPIDIGVVTDITTDKDGNIRPQGGGFDIGAYEYGTASGVQNEKISDLAVQIYPNPANENLCLENKLPGITSVNADIYNILGRKLLNKKLELPEDKIIDISGLSPGIYFVQLSNSSIRYSSKIIVVH